MLDFKYRALATAPIPNWGWELKDFRSESLRDVSDAFLANLVRTSTFILMPAYLSLMVQRNQLWTDYATIKTGGEINPDVKEFNELSREIAKAAQPSVDKFLASSESELRALIGNVGIKYVERTLEFADGIRISMYALLSSVILESWTTFETLSSDLWVTAVDNGPKEVAARVSLSKQLQKPDDLITPETVHHLEYDARTQLGSFLRETGRVSFQKLDYIRLYYSEAFGKDVRKLFDETEGGYIFALSAFRNALIHNSGKADKHFVERVQRFPEFRHIAKGDDLLLNGDTVRKLRDSAMFLGRALIQFVDNVLTPQEQP